MYGARNCYVAHITSNTDTTKELILIDKEELCDRVEGVMNLSKDYGQLGTLWVTNLRIAWAAALQDNYNCSVPFIQVRAETNMSAAAPSSWCCIEQRQMRCT